jgi:phage terminase small subunit
MTPRQSRFIHEYLKDLNATQAAIRAGYSMKTAESCGSRLLSFAKVKREIDAAIARRAVRVEVKADDVLRELLRLGTVNITEAFDRNGALLPPHEIPEDVQRAIVSIETDEMTDAEGVVIGHTRKVKFSDKKGPLELLGRHLGMFAEKHELEAGSKLMELLKGVQPKKLEALAEEVAGMSPDEQTEVARGRK